jgi:hypothetical protein
VAEEVNVAELAVPPVLEATVTVCGADQLAGVKVRLAPAVTERFADPDARAVVTVTFAAGAEARLTV